ncbi:MAG: sigma 54-interacting transcriptional regulator [Myxococcales bacterium]|nr:sigma 54-interacting transcriptional regulator [Myxococcales bacterium]
MVTHSVASRTLGETMEDDARDERRGDARSPGILLVFCDRAPTFLAVKLGPEGVRLGRDELLRVGLRDERMSRTHAHVWCDGGSVFVRDVGSRNGTWVDGEHLRESDGPRELDRVLRCGRSLWVCVDDVRPYLRSAVEERGGFVIGPRLRGALAEIESLAERSPTVFVRGESGAGKELAARTFHDASPGRAGPFVAVNCATVPAALAERLFFGARRGVYSGAHEDTVGYFQAADGGTLFLDEIAELDSATQAKLLRAIETREITALGHTKSRPVDLRIVAATLAPLEQAVEQGRFRADLYHRIAAPNVWIPPLRQRGEEVPFLVRRALAASNAESAIDAELIEQCLLREWPGNVRQLTHELSQCAAQWARDPSRGLRLAPLDTDRRGPRSDLPPESDPPSQRPPPRRASSITEQDARAAVARCGGNISAAARSLGVHRTQLRRVLAQSEPSD